MGDRTARVPIVCATANPHKVAELEATLGDLVELLPRPDSVGEIVEDAGTLVGNARLKARAIAGATGRAALADDTGLEVDALDGAPGVDSAYFAGPDATYEQNVEKLLDELAERHDAERTARFRTVILVRWPDGQELIAEGRVDGTIVSSPRGSNGFGYDPVFVPADGDGRSFAEMDPQEKNGISHRSRAVAELLRIMSEDGFPEPA